MALTKNLSTPTGATKSVQDTGALIDPAMYTIDGVSSVAQAAIGVAKDVKAARDKKKASARQTKRQDASDARAEASAARAQNAENRAAQTFANTQEDRVKKTLDSSFEDDAERVVMRLDKVQRGISQKGGSQAQLSLTLESETTALLQQYPGYEAELGAYMQKRGFQSTFFQGLDDAQKQHVSERDNRLQRQEEAKDVAFQSGLVDENTPEKEAISIGQSIQAYKAETAILKERAQILNDNKRMSIEERKAEQGQIDRKMAQAASKGASTITGAVTSAVLSQMSNATPDNYKQITSKIPTKILELEAGREQLYQDYGYNADAMKAIDKGIDASKKMLVDMSSGDYSQAKANATSLSNMKSSFGLDLYEVAPIMGIVDSLPAPMQDSIYSGTGMFKGMMPEMQKGLLDSMQRIDSMERQRFESLQKNTGGPKGDEPRPPLETLSIKEAQDRVQYDSFNQKESLRKVIDPNTSPEEMTPNLDTFIDSQVHLLPAFERVISESSKSGVEDALIGVDKIASPQVAQALEIAMQNPAFKEEAEMVMSSTRNQMQKALDLVSTNSKETGGMFTSGFDPRAGRYSAMFNGDRVDGAKKMAGNFGIGASLISNEDLRLRALKEGPNPKMERKIEVLNKAMDFLARTRDHDKSVKPNITELEYRNAYASKDFSGVFQDNPAELGDTSIDPSMIDYTEASFKGMALSSAYRVKEESLAPALDSAATSLNLPPALVHSMADTETGHLTGENRETVTNKWGARGIMQVTKPTAEEMGYSWEDMLDPEINAKAGSEYMSDQLANFNGDIEDALMAYNAGPTKVRKWIREGRPIVQGKSWQTNAFPYVEKILSNLENTQTNEGDN